MPAVIPINGLVRAQFLVLSLHPAGDPPIPLGVLLLGSTAEEFDFRLRNDWDELPLAVEDQEYVSYLAEDFRSRAAELGPSHFVEMLEDSLSGFMRLSSRESVSGRSFDRILERLFFEHVDTRVQPYKTHLPLYGLRAAATKFGEDSEVSESDVEWVRAPGDLRLSNDLFIVRVVGRSMEPLIPDGSLAIFRKIRPGSRGGKRLLIEELGATSTSARYTVKRYTSTKKHSGYDEWEHGTIRLEPLNPEFPAFELDPEAFEGRYRVLGEFVQVLSTDD